MEDSHLAACQQVHRALMTSKHAKSFLEPVDWKTLNIPSYPQIVTNPMDLGTIQTKLNSSQYSSPRAWEQDVRLVVTNCKTFNLKDSPYIKMAEQLEACLNKRLPKLTKELQLWDNMKDASQWLDWRSRLVNVIAELKAMPEAQFFVMPVDWRAMGLHDYPKIIEKPMDMFTCESKLRDPDAYRSPYDCVSDIWLIWRNAMKYNREGTAAHRMAKKMADSSRHKLVKAFRPDEEDEAGGGKRRKLEGRDKISITDLEKTSPLLDYEYTNLRDEMAKLTPDELQRAVIVAQERNVSSVISTMDCVTLDLDQFDPGDLRYFAKYVAAHKN